MLHHSRTLVGEHRGDDFLQGRSLIFTLGLNPLHVFSCSGNNTRELCCMRRCLYSTAKLQPVLYINYSIPYCYLLRSPSSPIRLPAAHIHIPSLSLALTHLTHRLIPERSYATLTTTDRSTSAASGLTSQDLMVTQ